MDSLINKVRIANPKRKKKNIDRRLLKLGEEYGETVQAYLAVSSKNNIKKKSWQDVREELSDVVIVALDILLTEMPDENYDDKLKEREIETRICSEISRKLMKWTDKIIDKKNETDDAE